jgi:hypothetical protein
LWRSTLFAIAAGLQTLLRKHNAKARHWLWLTASAPEFLIPFFFAGPTIGSQFLLRPLPHLPVRPVVYFAIEEIQSTFQLNWCPLLAGPLAFIASSILRS